MLKKSLGLALVASMIFAQQSVNAFKLKNGNGDYVHFEKGGKVFLILKKWAADQVFRPTEFTFKITNEKKDIKGYEVFIEEKNTKGTEYIQSAEGKLPTIGDATKLTTGAYNAMKEHYKKIEELKVSKHHEDWLHGQDIILDMEVYDLMTSASRHERGSYTIEK